MKTRELAVALVDAHHQAAAAGDDAEAREGQRTRARRAAEDFFTARAPTAEKLDALWAKTAVPGARGTARHPDDFLDFFRACVPGAGTWRPPAGEAGERWRLATAAAEVWPLGVELWQEDEPYPRLSQVIADACRQDAKRTHLTLPHLIENAIGARGIAIDMMVRRDMAHLERIPVDAWVTASPTSLRAEDDDREALRNLFLELQHWLLNCGAEDVRFAGVRGDLGAAAAATSGEGSPRRGGEGDIWVRLEEVELTLRLPPAALRPLLPLQMKTFRRLRAREDCGSSF